MSENQSNTKCLPILVRRSSYDLSGAIDIDGFEDCGIILGNHKNDEWQFKPNEDSNIKDQYVDARQNLYRYAKKMIKEELQHEILALELDENCIGSICNDGSIILIRKDHDGPFYFYYINELLFNKSRIDVSKVVKFKEAVLQMIDI